MTEDEDQEIVAALAKLAGQDAAAADDARAALEWIAGEQGLAFITQARIQNFCWYDLPVKWFVDLDEKVRITAALAQVLDLLQLPRYAAICRSQTTREILAAYETGTAYGTAAFRRAATASSLATYFETVYNSPVTAQLTMRSRDEITRLCDGFTLTEPGLVWIPQWRPDAPDDASKYWALVGVGRYDGPPSSG